MIDLTFERKRRKLRPVNVVSLVDIVFTVILFFLIAGHMEKFSIITVELPKADSGQGLEEGPVVVVLGRFDEILVNDELYDLSQVAGVVARELQNNPERIITIKADARLEANKLVDFMEQLRAAGGRNISLVTEAGSGA